MNRQIAITKAGCISNYGVGVDDFIKNVTNVKKTDNIRIFETEKYSVKKAHVLNDYDPKTVLGEKGLRNLNRNTLFILSAIKKDFENEINYFKTNGKRLGLTIGTAFGSLASISDYELEIFEKTPRKINPMGFANTVLNSPTSRANIWFELTASSTTISSGGVSGAKAIEFSMNQLLSGNIDAMLCGGAEELNMQTFLGYYLNGYLTQNNEIIPYDNNSGTILSEGCAMVLLETLNKANQRNATVLGVIEGYGTAFYGSINNSDNFRTDGIKKAIGQALDEAGIDSGDIGLIISSANGIGPFDKMEEKALIEIFGDKMEEIPVIPLKSIIGDNIGAFNLFQLVYGINSRNYGNYPIIYKYHKNANKLINDNNFQINTSKNKKILLNCCSECGNHSAIIINIEN